MERESVERQAEKNIFQHSSKFQNTAGVAISYAYNVPPIGAPNAAATPAAYPQAAMFLLSVLFLKILKKGKRGKYKIICPTIEPI